MLIAFRSGDISAAKLVRETDSAWTLTVEKKEVRISKADTRRKVFTVMSDALKWTGAEQELIDYTLEQEAKRASANPA